MAARRRSVRLSEDTPKRPSHFVHRIHPGGDGPAGRSSSLMVCATRWPADEEPYETCTAPTMINAEASTVVSAPAAVGGAPRENLVDRPGQ